MLYNFDAHAVNPQQPLEPVPEGWYPVVIGSEEQKPVKDKTHCWLLSFAYDIIDGPFKGRKIFANLNLGNDNPQAVESAHRELSSICHVTNTFVLNESTGGTAALKNKPFQVKVIVEGTRNQVKGYKDMQGNDPGKSGGQGHAQAPAAAPQPPAAPMQQASAPAAAAATWGAQAPAQAPQAAGAAWGAPAQPAQAAPAAWTPPAQQAAPAPAPAQAPAAAPWGGGAPAQPAQAQAPAPAAWTPPAAQAPSGGQAPWAR